MEIISAAATLNVRMSYELSYIEIDAGKHAAWRLVRGVSADTPMLAQLQERLQPTVEEGIATVQQVLAFQFGQSARIVCADLMLAKPGLLEAVRTQGFSRGIESMLAADGAFSDTPFTDLTQGGASCENLVVCDYASHMLFAPDGTSLPVGLRCGYINARMHDGAYDLEAAVALLRKDPRVVFLAQDRACDASQGTVIHDVPRYNAREGCTRHLDFLFVPTHEDAKRLWEQQQSYRSAYPSTQVYRAMFDLDILGLRAAGIARHADFYE